MDPDAGAPSLLIVSDELQLVVLDLSDPDAPAPAAGDRASEREDDEPLPLYALAHDPRGFVYAGRLGAIWIHRLHPDARVEYVRSIEPPYPDDAPLPEVRDVVVHDGHLYAALGQAGVAVFDLADPARPRPIAQIPAQRAIFDLALLPGARLATYDGWRVGLVVYDITDPARPRVESPARGDSVGVYTAGMAALGGIVAVNLHEEARRPVPYGGLVFVDARDPGEPRTYPRDFGLQAPQGSHVSLRAAGGRTFGYFADGASGLVIAEAAPRSTTRALLPLGSVSETAIVGRHLYVADGASTLSTYTVSDDDPTAPRWVSSTALDVGALHLLAIER